MALPNNASCTDEEFIDYFRTYGPREMARSFNMGLRSIMSRRRRLEQRYGVTLVAPYDPRNFGPQEEYPWRSELRVSDGIVLVGSDAHIWPGSTSLAMRAFIQFARRLQPGAIILNGDVMDFPNISRHPPIGWEKHPPVVDQIEAAQKVLGALEGIVFRGKLFWTLGNHDSRFETRLATIAPEYARLNGVHLRDYFPLWEPAWSAFINDDVVVKHRFKGGIHATHNNTLWSGRTTVTGHLHSQKITPFTDYDGDRYGVDSGCLADPNHRAFVDYTEDNPKNWRSGFAILTFRGGILLPPELVTVWDKTRVWFRGDLVEVNEDDPLKE